MTSRSLFPAWILLAALVASAPGVEGGEKDENVFASESCRFRIAKPGADWSFQETGDASKGSYRLVVSLKEAGGKVQVTVRVAMPGASSAVPKRLRDNALKSIEGKPAYTAAKKTVMRLAGRSAPALEVSMESGGETYRIRQGYLAEHGLIFTVGFHAPAKALPSRLSTLEGVCATFRFLEAPPELVGKRRLHALASRCGTEFRWAAEWKPASDQARREKKLLLVLVRSISGFQITNSFLTSTFMDPDVVQLVRHRFVALRFRKSMGAPFESHAVYGLGPSTFGTTLLVVTPEGKVVGDTACYEPTAVHDLLIRCLAANPAWCRVVAPEDLRGAERAAWFLHRGEYEKAGALLRSPAAPEEHRLKAALLRRLRKGEEALDELEKARKSEKAVLDEDLDLDAAVLKIRMRRYREAYALLAGVMNRHPDHRREPEALFWRGACTFGLAGAKRAKAVWDGLIEKYPKSRWAWKAAAVVTATSFAMGSMERLDWPSDEERGILLLPELRALSSAKAREAERDALEYLLSAQRSDGSWMSPSEVMMASKKIPHDFTVAITAIGGLALLPYREEPRVARALHLAAGYLLHAREVAKAVGDRAYFMDYTVWRKAYVLWFFSECIETGFLRKKPLETMLSKIVEELHGKQKSGGGWSYYVTRELGEAKKPSDQSISFCTAAVMSALREAREAGIPLPEAMVSAGLGCLLRMKNGDGTFEYML
ncbi:MAG: hypothetical protein ACYS47_06655, partial [Planctomycetota bacterium]